ncbi:putative uncharacterized protein DDB_G0274435 [Drosophila busckii]|uniref:putative uncharacterized protein DDB_G0274435 n=1 Tax=Drosophila busckii TaxID=30019 RepID=UPI00083EBC92|nr:putative uncharacterized protein DDB_G0274435 [Drosophila busckii]
MACIGTVDSDLDSEVHTGKTRINFLSPTDHSKRSNVSSPDFLSPQQWRSRDMAPSSDSMYAREASSSNSSLPLSLPTADAPETYSDRRTIDSVYSWSNTCSGVSKHMESQSQSEMRMRIPSLRLSSKGSTFDYLRELGDLKLPREPKMAYEHWRVSKLKLRQQRLERERIERQEAQQIIQTRKKAAEFSYNKWKQNKLRQAAEQRASSAQNSSSSESLTKKSGKSSRNVSQAEIRQVVESWWHKKQEQRQRQREQQQQHLLQQAEQKQQRKQQAEQAWLKWVSKVCEKPKPVPLNQGINSLRGTISQIYINPVRWQSLKKER